MVMPKHNMFAPWLLHNYRPEGAPYGPILKTMATRNVRDYAPQRGRATMLCRLRLR